MYYSINPANPDLIGYWPTDEGKGNTLLISQEMDMKPQPILALYCVGNLKFGLINYIIQAHSA